MDVAMVTTGVLGRRPSALWLAVLVPPLLGCGHAAKKRAAQEDLIAALVVLETMSEGTSPSSPPPKPSAVCVFRGEAPAGKSEDPSESLLKVLRSRGIQAVPVSACQFPEFIVRATGARAIVVGVSPIEWRSDTFVKLKTARQLDCLSGRGWIYTLSLERGQWMIDTVHDDTWIS